MAYKRITIVTRIKPVKKDVNGELQWLGNSLGLFSLRDKDNSCFRLFIELLKCTRKNIPVSSDELAYRLKLSRGTVVYHINKLIESGIVISDKNKYILRSESLESVIHEIRKDLERAFTDLEDVAHQIDRELGL